MKILVSLLGAGLVLAALRDIFQQLFRPSGAGSLSRFLMRAVWRMFRRLGHHKPAVFALVGPAVLLTIISAWILLLVTGWALIILPRLPGGFLLQTGLDPTFQNDLVAAFYVSMVTLATLGYGDIVPRDEPLRVLLPLEALIGFALVTAAISWVLSIYPALSRRRSLAHEITLLSEAESETGIDVTRTDPEAASRRLDSFASQLVSVRGDLLQFPVTYYFYTGDERTALPARLPMLARLARRGAGARAPAVRLGAAALRGAVQDFSETLASHFLGGTASSTGEVLAAYARDHLRR
jgi:hypothetical protein